ncbi:hypothetical protein DESME_08190 [Desulfitobacterium metallireducens DSM 15288]|uniref:Phage holin family protein n=2 Tax=Desulfitobacterium TaxID=36853 RepID=W0E854_9FIRM|nr:hypothetical protein DESME_08190 [Desulfitobacterium metallireducens DSM 15288]
MEAIADFVIKIVDLVEAEFSELKGKAINTVVGIGLILLAVVMAMVGFVMGIYGIYLTLCIFMPPFLAAFANAALAFIIGGGLLQWAKRKLS